MRNPPESILLESILPAACAPLLRVSGKYTRRLFDHIPAQCVVCNAPALHHNLCELCLQDLPRLNSACERCALPITEGTLCGPCIINPPPWLSMTCAVPYTAPYDTLMARLKFRGQQNIAPALSALLIEALTRPSTDTVVTYTSPLDAAFPDMIVPMPLHWLRLWQRGFNQAALLAQPVGEYFGMEVTHALLRSRYTRAQTLLDTRQRVANVRNAFRLASPVAGRNVALLDDVATTCATVTAATRVLLESKASSVRLWTVARAFSKHPSRTSARRTSTRLKA